MTHAVLFTDGFAPQPHRGEVGEPGVGAVLFAKRLPAALAFHETVKPEWMARWLPRLNQIALIELFAVVLAVHTFRSVLAGQRLLIFVDSESVEGALIKGYSRTQDICELVGIFWSLVAELDTLVYIDRVSTDANISDKPSRGNLEIAQRCGWEVLRAQWTDMGLG